MKLRSFVAMMTRGAAVAVWTVGIAVAHMALPVVLAGSLVDWPFRCLLQFGSLASPRWLEGLRAWSGRYPNTSERYRRAATRWP